MSQILVALGWRIDLEDFDALEAECSDEKEVLAMRGHFDPTMNTDFDARKILRVENQGRQGSCQGHAISTAVEWASCISIGEKSLELSRAMGYYETQRIDDIRGDRGSTISGGIKLATTVGICKEELWPYPSRYNNHRPHNYDAVLSSAKRFRAFNKVLIRTPEAWDTFLAAGLGGISIGIRWNGSVKRAHVDNFSGSGGGGHAVFVPQRSRKRQGCSDMINSHSKRFGDQGWSTWADCARDQMLKDRYTVAIGISDMENLEPRKITFNEFMDDMTLFG